MAAADVRGAKFRAASGRGMVMRWATAITFIGLPIPRRSSEGEVVVNAPTFPHQQVLRVLDHALEAWIRRSRRRSAMCRSGPKTLRSTRSLRTPSYGIARYSSAVIVRRSSPHGLWYADGHAPARDAQRPYPMPDLAVEARSPSTWRYDIAAKKAAYERNGLPELWLIDPTTEDVFAFRRSTPKSSSFDIALELGRGDTLSSPQLPGFAVPLAALFADDH